MTSAEPGGDPGTVTPPETPPTPPPLLPVSWEWSRSVASCSLAAPALCPAPGCQRSCWVSETVTGTAVRLGPGPHPLSSRSANLSDSYFTNRQDRYVFLQDCADVADFFTELVDAVGDVSLQLQGDDTVRVVEGMVHPYQGGRGPRCPRAGAGGVRAEESSLCLVLLLSLEPDRATHWPSAVPCGRGSSREGVWGQGCWSPPSSALLAQRLCARPHCGLCCRPGSWLSGPLCSCGSVALTSWGPLSLLLGWRVSVRRAGVKPRPTRPGEVLLGSPRMGASERTPSGGRPAP